MMVQAILAYRNNGNGINMYMCPPDNSPGWVERKVGLGGRLRLGAIVVQCSMFGQFYQKGLQTDMLMLAMFGLVTGRNCLPHVGNSDSPEPLFFYKGPILPPTILKGLLISIYTIPPYR
jgi:hypothetical protein